MQSTTASSVVFDGEILLIDTETGRPLPFGTFAKHKQKEHEGETCIFLFDILYLEGENLLQVSMEQRRKKLEQAIKVIPNRVHLSESTFMTKVSDLDEKLNQVMSEGLEGLVIKERDSIYEPNMRHWFKIKRDYLQGQSDSADLIVLGANYGTGRYGGVMTAFIMGVFDPETEKFKTVCRAGNGHTDEALKKINDELKAIKISHDRTKVPAWLDIHREFVPDFVVQNPREAPIWEIRVSC